MQIHCRCGQPFTVLAEQFPRQISCHVCGRHFNVLDDGDTIGDDEPTQVTAVVAETAVQADQALSLLNSKSSAFCTEDTKDALAARSEDAAQYARLQAELRSIDLQWIAERNLYALIPFIGIVPSKSLSVHVGMIAIVGFMALFALGVCPATIGPPVVVLVAAYIHRQAHEYEKAEADWQRQRIIAIAKYEAKASLH